MDYNSSWEEYFIGYVNGTAYYKKTVLVVLSAYYARKQSKRVGDLTDKLRFTGFSAPSGLVPA